MSSGITSPESVDVLRAAYRRSAWLGVVVGVVAGAVLGLVQGLQGYAGDLPVFLILMTSVGLAGAGAVVGLTAAVIAATRALAHPSRARRLVIVTAASGSSAALLAGLVFLVTPWWLPVAVGAVGVFAAVVGLGVGALAERSAAGPERPMRVTSTSSGRSPLGPIAIVAGVAAMLPFGGAFVTLLRDRLHALCWYGEPGTEAAGWMCPDGISYLGAGFLPVGTGFLLGVAGLIAALADRRPRRRRVTLTVLATLVVAVGIASTWSAANGDAGDALRVEAWVAAVLPAAIVAGVALGVALAALVNSGRAALVLAWLAAAGILVATVLQPGLGVATAPALGLLLAATVDASSAPTD